MLMTATTNSLKMTSYISFGIVLLAAFAVRDLARACSFPEALQMEPKDPPWYSHVKADGSRDVEYYIRHSVMEIHYPNSDRNAVRWKCSMAFHEKLLLKRQDHLVNNYYRCVQFMLRSKSVVQIMWSHEMKTFDISLCEDSHLKLDPWLLVWYGTIEKDYNQCPFSGGYDMKMVDSQLGENGCNLMLRPMRMEAECTGGEGVIFNYMSQNCLPDINMFVKQQTVCLTDWQDKVSHYVVLRRSQDLDLWCLVMPIRRGTDVTAYLYSDLTCMTDADRVTMPKHLKYFTLHLHMRQFPTLCEDEYEQCEKISCNRYVKQECRKSCDMCAHKSLPPTCEYPRRFYGPWFLKDMDGYRHVDISPTHLKIDGVGDFQCVTFPDSPSRKSRVYTALSVYNNGCRPRYTCIKFHRLGPSVLQYSLSQSYTWPALGDKFGENICHKGRFQADPMPIDDRYRAYEGTGMPIIAQLPVPETVHCNLTHVHTVSARLPQGYQCAGSLYRHCEDPTKLRLEFHSCGSLVPAFTDYRCLANFEGHYWERLLLVQNIHDEKDAICFVFSQFYSSEAYVLVASQCDKKSFNFARTGLRQPLLKLQFNKEEETCKSVPVAPTTTTPRPTEPRIGPPLDPNSSMRDDSRNTHVRTNSTNMEHGRHGPVSILVTGSPSGHAKDGVYNSAEDGAGSPSAKSTSLGDEDSLRSSKNNNNNATGFRSRTRWICVMLVISLLFWP